MSSFKNERTAWEACPVYLSLKTLYETHGIHFHKIMSEINLDYLDAKIKRGMTNFNIPHFSHSSRCKISNIRCLPMQYVRVRLRLQYCIPNFNMRAKFTECLKCPSLSWRTLWKHLRVADVTPEGRGFAITDLHTT